MPARVLEVITPGGFEAYFTELFELARRSPGGPPDATAMTAIQERYGLTMDLESLPRLLAEHGLRPPRL